jgi:hypothetical protein
MMMMTTKQSVFVNAAIKGRKRQISEKAKDDVFLNVADNREYLVGFMKYLYLL